MKILLTNNRCQLQGKPKYVIKLRNSALLAVKVKGAFFSPAYKSRRWDGFYRTVSDAGYFETGLLPTVLRLLKEWGEPVTIKDNRTSKVEGKLPKRLNGHELREYQLEGLSKILNHKVGGLRFPKCMIFAATNYGKTITSAGIYKMYNSPTAYFVNSKELFNQMIVELEEFIPGKVGYISSEKGEKWNDFMVIMVPTAYSRKAKIGPKLAKFKVVIVDECDLAASKTWKSVLSYTFNAYVKVGMSGSALADPRKKELNLKLTAAFGDVIFKVKNKDLMEQGFSADVRVTILNGNTTIKEKGDYRYEYDYGIIKNPERNKKIMKRIAFHKKKGRLPILVMAQRRKHISTLFNKISRRVKKKGHALYGLTVDWVDHKREDRDEVVKRFKDGKLDILVGSYILKRGKNFPLMRAIINGAGGDSIANVLQILGRATRTHKSKEYTYLDDFYDKGFYIRRHSLHRFQTYKNEGLQIKDCVNLNLLK